MRVFLVNPSDTSFGMAVITPRWLFVLAAATPARLGVPTIVDETLKPFDLAAVGPDAVVGIGIHTGNALRGYAIGREARRRGATVVFGGIHATLFPDEALAKGGAHAIVSGDGDLVWSRVLTDAAVGSVQARYEGGKVAGNQLIAARWDLLPAGRYMWASVQTVRGCPKHCSFCSVWRTDGQAPRLRTVDVVMQEIVELRRRGFRFIALADDNFYPVALKDLAQAARRQDTSALRELEARRAERFELMRRLAALPSDSVFFTQITMEAAEDPDFLDAMRRANIKGALVGVEAVTPEGLKSVYKDFNLAGEALVDRLRTFRKHGVHVLGSFIFGLPSDRPDAFEATAALAEQSGITFAQFVMLTPFPGTLDFERWEKSYGEAPPTVDGIPLTRHWLIPAARRPKFYMPHPTMAHEEVRARTQAVWDRFYRLSTGVGAQSMCRFAQGPARVRAHLEAVPPDVCEHRHRRRQRAAVPRAVLGAPAAEADAAPVRRTAPASAGGTVVKNGAPLPVIIQGGMGVGISDWRLAQAVSSAGQLGVVSGTALDTIMVRRLQSGDPGGHVRRALARLPFRRMASGILRRYFVAGAKPPMRPYVALPLHAHDDPGELVALCIAANFVEVTLAREGHTNPVGINFLEKIQVPHLPSLFGAMLAGVSYVLMGAGIPNKIPGVLDRLARFDPASYPLQVTGAEPGDDVVMHFDPRDFVEENLPPLTRPAFMPIVSSHVLAATLLRKSNGVVNGFVVEGPTAGGHNAPPRGRLQLDEAGEPVYGDRDVVDLEKMSALGVPFWLAGGYGHAGGLETARAAGAYGIQVGTAFAFCDESGMQSDYKTRLRELAASGAARVTTDPRASPTSFPLKVADLAGSLSSDAVYAARTRVCDLGYLREAYRTPEGGVGFRCAAEPVAIFVAKGGRAEDTVGRKCICNALVATMGYPQARGRALEPPLITSGNALSHLDEFMPHGRTSFTASDVIRVLLAGEERS